MRAWVVILGLLAAAPALAAPTCQDRQGGTIKCGAPGAMPVGWKPSPEQLWERELSQPPGPGAGKLLGVFCGLVLLFALIALMPDFDAWRDDSEDKMGDS
jgi:hypothetical protein